MKLYSHENIISLDDEFALYSPYLKKLMETDVRLDMVDDAYVIDEEIISLDDLIAYTSLISGFYSYVPSYVLEYMGHENPLEYPDEFFSIKIYDNWVRDNFYKYELDKTPLFGLEEVPINPERYDRVMSIFNGNRLPNDTYIAGSAAMYLADVVNDYTDVDLFVTSDDVNVIIHQINDVHHVYDTGNSISMTRYRASHDLSKRDIVHELPDIGCKYVQIVLRLYSSPSEIVHGFDLDSCGYILVEDKLYRTLRAKYSTELKMNFFDSQRSSPTYANRLSKYNLRGFDIWLPYLDRISFNEEFFQKISMEVYEKNKQHIKDMDPRNINFKPIPFSIGREDLNIDDGMFYFKIHSKIMEEYGFDPIISTLLILYNIKSVKFDIPNDIVSKIILSKFKKIYLSNMTTDKQADYVKMGYTIVDMTRERALEIEWQLDSIDPMKQLSGTFYPEPIEEDIIQWYSQSPFVLMQ